jgi:hypothetical protein
MSDDDPLNCSRCHATTSVAAGCEMPEDPRLQVCHSCVYDVAEEALARLDRYRDLVAHWRSKADRHEEERSQLVCMTEEDCEAVERLTEFIDNLRIMASEVEAILLQTPKEYE